MTALSCASFFVFLPHFAPKRDKRFNTLGEGVLSAALRRSFFTEMNRTVFSSPGQHRLTPARVSFPLLTFLPPTHLALGRPYSRHALFHLERELQVWRREHYHLQRVGGRASRNAHELPPSLTARAEIKTPEAAANSPASETGCF